MSRLWQHPLPANTNPWDQSYLTIRPSSAFPAEAKYCRLQSSHPSQSLSVSSSHSDVFCNWTRQRRWRWTIVVAFVATAQLRIWWTGCLLKESLVSLRHCGAPQGASVKSGPQTSWQIGGCSLKATFAGYFESAVSTESVSFSVWLYSHLFTDNRPSPAGTHHT